MRATRPIPLSLFKGESMHEKIRTEQEIIAGLRQDELYERRLSRERGVWHRRCMTRREIPLEQRACCWCGLRFWTLDNSVVCVGCEWVNQELPRMLREIRVRDGGQLSQAREDMTCLGHG